MRQIANHISELFTNPVAGSLPQPFRLPKHLLYIKRHLIPHDEICCPGQFCRKRLGGYRRIPLCKLALIANKGVRS